MLHEVHGDRDRVDAGEAEAPVGLPAQELECALVERRDLRVQLADGLGIDGVLEDEEAASS